MNEIHKRRIRSFVRREGRITAGQQQALENYWPHYGLSVDMGPLDFQQVFARKSDVILEIGFGMGQSLLEMASQHLDRDYVGVEVHRPGVGALLAHIHAQGLTNVRVVQHDAVEFLRVCIPNESLAGIQIYFPDPWPKKRHHKRRLIQADFIQLAKVRLKLGGYMHFATDWQNYAEQMLAVMTAAEGFNNVAGHGCYMQDQSHALRPMTKFEQRGQRLGHAVWDLFFVRVK